MLESKKKEIKYLRDSISYYKCVLFEYQREERDIQDRIADIEKYIEKIDGEIECLELTEKN